MYDECILVNQTYAEYRDYYCSNGKCLYTSTDYPGCAVTFCNGIIHYFSNDWITPIKYWQTFSGYLENQMDSKRVNVNITSLGKFAFSFCDDGGNSTFDTYLCLFDYRGNLISQNDDFCELNSKIVSNLTKGYYYLQIVAKNQSEKYDFNLAYKQITCDLVSPNVTIINPYSFPGGNLTVNFNFYCGEWDYSPSRDLNVKLLIDGNEWVECFLNDKNISKDLGWSMDECDHQGKKCKKGKKTSNNMWECDENLYCKHKDYPLIVYSNSLAEFVNVTFTCKLPYGLRGGIHKLSVIPTIYSNPITLKPRVTSFIILPANLINMVKLPMEIVKSFINSILKF
ncbi:MAG: DVUA0089 family protein [Candidatus Aenigmatarchaeota archaeon]